MSHCSRLSILLAVGYFPLRACGWHGLACGPAVPQNPARATTPLKSQSHPMSRIIKPDEINLGGYALYACTQCDLRFAPAAFDAKVDYAHVYETAEYIANQVVPIQSGVDFKSFAEHCTYRPFFQRVQQRPTATLLDVGCGVGRFCHAAHYRGWNVTGIDVSTTAVQIGSRYATFPLTEASVEDLLSRSQRFDVVTAFEVLEHLSKPLRFLISLKELASSKGQVFCTVPNWDCQEVRTATKADWVPPIHLCFFSLTALERLGFLAGFDRVTVGVVSTDPFPGCMPHGLRWLARRVIGRPRRPLGLWLHGHK